MPHGFAPSDFTISVAVIRNEKAELSIRDQMQVTVKILSISPMPDDAMPIAGLFIKTECHCIHARQVLELPRMHESGRLWLEDLDILEPAILYVSHHEVSHFHCRHGRA